MRAFFTNFFKRRKTAPEDIEHKISLELEAAKQALMADLKSKGVKFLLSKMNSREFYSPLIEEKRKVSYSSDDTVDWHAFKHSGTLNSPGDKEELLALLSDPEYSDQKRDIYCCLASLCTNTADFELFNFLMNTIKEEEEERTIVSILSRLENLNKPAGLNIDPIKKYLVEGTDSERIAAGRALSNTNDPTVESLILDEFRTGDRHFKGMLCTPLRSIGTAISIPILQEAHKKTRDPGLLRSIENVIYNIEKKESDNPTT